MLKRYLLERVINHYVENTDEVLKQFSMRSLLFGSVQLDQVKFVPSAIQDAFFVSIPYGLEVTRCVAYQVQVEIDWLAIPKVSVRMRIRSMAVDAMAWDPGDGNPSAGTFFEAQARRNLVAASAAAEPVQSSLATKVAAGACATVDSTSFRIGVAAGDDVLLTCHGLHYGPATKTGDPTSDVEVALRWKPDLAELSCDYVASLQRVVWAAPHSTSQVIVEGVAVHMSGRLPSVGIADATFYGEGSTSAKVKELRSLGGPVSAQALSHLVSVMSGLSASNALRESGGDRAADEDSKAKRPTHLMRFQSCRREEGDHLQAGAIFNERLQTELAFADLFQDCARRCSKPSATLSRSGAGYLKRALTQRGTAGFVAFEECIGEEDDSDESARESDENFELQQHGLLADKKARDIDAWEASARKTISRQVTRRFSRFLSIDADDSAELEPRTARGTLRRGRTSRFLTPDWLEEFKECDEVGAEEQQQCEVMSDSDVGVSLADSPWSSVVNGTLSRTIAALDMLHLEIRMPDGVVEFDLSGLRCSMDSRIAIKPEQLECLCALFASPEAGIALDAADGVPLGILHAGVALTSAQLSFRPRHAPSDKLVAMQLGGMPGAIGLLAQHRGDADPVMASNCGPASPARGSASTALRLLEVRVIGLCLKDVWRDCLQALAELMQESVTPSPGIGESQVSTPIAYSLEASEVTLEGEAGQEMWHISLPSIRSRNVLSSFADIWAEGILGPTVTRTLRDPLGAPYPMRASGASADRGLAHTQTMPRHVDHSCADVIANLHRRLFEAGQMIEEQRRDILLLEGKFLEDTSDFVLDVIPFSGRAPPWMRIFWIAAGFSLASGVSLLIGRKSANVQGFRA